MKCDPPCGKTRFDSEWRATLGAILIALRDNVALTPYRSPECKTYHLSGHNAGKPRRSGRKTQAIKKFTTQKEGDGKVVER